MALHCNAVLIEIQHKHCVFVQRFGPGLGPCPGPGPGLSPGPGPGPCSDPGPSPPFSAPAPSPPPCCDSDISRSRWFHPL